jgi:hypothetical protein
MLVTQYTHRLPADYGMTRIRQRAASRGPDWDSLPGLIFKGFLIREKGKLGIASNAYSSLYLWRDTDALAAMIAGDRFQAVIDAFGRPAVETFVVLASAFGPAQEAAFVHRADELVPAGADLAALKEQEAKAAHDSAENGESFAAVTALDVSGWRLSRFVLSASEVQDRLPQAVRYEIAYLAKPGRR